MNQSLLNEQRQDYIRHSVLPPGATEPVHIKSTEPARIIEIPVVQNIDIQTRVVEKPEVHTVDKYRDRIKIEEIIKKIPKIEVVTRDKIVEVPEYREVERKISIPHIVTKIIEVPKIEYRDVIKEVPKYVTQYIEKIVEIPQVQYIERVVEVPEYEQAIKRVYKTKLIEIPIERLRYIPKIEIQQIEKIRYIPGDIEIRERLIKKPVPRPYPQSVEVYQHRHVRKDIFLDREIEIDVPGQIIDIPFSVDKYVDRIIPKFVPGRIIDRHVPVPIKKVVEILVPEPKEEIKIVKKERQVVKEIVKEIEVMKTIEEFIDVPRYVYIESPRTIIKPKYSKEYHTLPVISSRLSPRFTRHVEHLEPIYDHPSIITPSTTTHIGNSSPSIEPETCTQDVLISSNPLLKTTEDHQLESPRKFTTPSSMVYIPYKKNNLHPTYSSLHDDQTITSSEDIVPTKIFRPSLRHTFSVRRRHPVQDKTTIVGRSSQQILPHPTILRKKASHKKF